MFSISCYHVFDLRRQTDFTNKSAKPEKKKKKSSKAIKHQSWSKLSLENKSYELGRRLLNFAVYWEKLPFCLICSLWLGSAPNRILNWIKNQNMATLRRFKHNKRRKWKSGKKDSLSRLFSFVWFVTNCKFVCQKLLNMQSVYWTSSDVLKWKTNTIDIAAISIKFKRQQTIAMLLFIFLKTKYCSYCTSSF